jgi:CrcB protein
MRQALLVGVGGFAGSVARYWVSVSVQGRSASAFLVGTLTVNVLGSLLLGLIVSASADRGWMGAQARLLLGVGFCGGFTTMSTFSYESIALFQQGAVGLAAWNMVLNLVVCLGAVGLGLALGRLV